MTCTGFDEFLCAQAKYIIYDIAIHHTHLKTLRVALWRLTECELPEVMDQYETRVAHQHSDFQWTFK